MSVMLTTARVGFMCGVCRNYTMLVTSTVIMDNQTDFDKGAEAYNYAVLANVIVGDYLIAAPRRIVN